MRPVMLASCSACTESVCFANVTVTPPMPAVGTAGNVDVGRPVRAMVAEVRQLLPDVDAACARLLGRPDQRYREAPSEPAWTWTAALSQYA